VVYQGDQTISWFTEGAQNIVEFNRSGTHVFTRVLRGAGDEAQGVAFFDAIDQLIVAVRNSDKAGMQRGLRETDALIDANALALVKVGADGKALDNQRDMIDESLVRLKSLRSEIEDLDYAEAVTQMNQEMLALQAAMTSFGRISQLNLFSVVDL
jgi:flagellar hook-associated protein 3 FlgL